MSDLDRKEQLQNANAEDLKEAAKERGVEGASSLKKEELVEELSKAEHAESPEVLGKLEDKVQIEYVGDYDVQAPDIVVPFLSDEQLARSMKHGDKFSMPRSLAKGVLANAYFQPVGSDAEKVRAELEEDSKRATYEARAVLAAPGSVQRDDSTGGAR